MAYKKREMYIINPDGEVQKELLDILRAKEGKIREKAGDIIFCSVPMSKIRWSRWLTPNEMSKYLVQYSTIEGL